jgi:hypothetical protein
MNDKIDVVSFTKLGARVNIKAKSFSRQLIFMLMFCEFFSFVYNLI